MFEKSFASHLGADKVREKKFEELTTELHEVKKEREEEAALIPGAHHALIERSGHIGMLTRPARFAGIVTGFVHANHH